MTAVDPRGQRSTLIASSLAVVVVMFNIAAVNPALPSLQQAFQTTPTDLQWAVNVYTITYAALLLVGGLLGARLGFRRVLLGGLAVGALGALLTALAPSYGLVLLGRGVAGRRCADPECPRRLVGDGLAGSGQETHGHHPDGSGQGRGTTGGVR